MVLHARPHLQTHTRSAGHSAVAGAAYRLGLRLYDEQTKKWHDFRKRQLGEEIVRALTVAPEGAPDWSTDPAQLWNRVPSETRGSSRAGDAMGVELPSFQVTAHQPPRIYPWSLPLQATPPPTTRAHLPEPRPPAWGSKSAPFPQTRSRHASSDPLIASVIPSTPSLARPDHPGLRGGSGASASWTEHGNRVVRLPPSVPTTQEAHHLL